MCCVCFLFLGNRTKFASTISNQQRKFKNLPDFEVIAIGKRTVCKSFYLQRLNSRSVVQAIQDSSLILRPSVSQFRPERKILRVNSCL